jgi:KDO2-lipid IV(A) lauroyltransferase
MARDIRMKPPVLEKRQPPRFDSSFFLPRYWSTWLALFFFRLAALLPVGLNLPIGRAIGKLFFHLGSSRRRVARTNIDLCFPELDELERERLVRSSIENCGISIMESALALWGAPGKLRRRSRVEGLENIAAVQARGQGVLLVACHFTTMDPAARILCDHIKLDVLYRKDPNPLLAYALTSAREAYVNRSIVRNDSRQLIRRLREGSVVWYTPDQDFGLKFGVFAPFFGVEAVTVTTGRVARLGQAAVLPYFHYRDEQGCYHIHIGPELQDYPQGDEVADATRLNQVIEEMIRRKPDQYLWVHRRFKTRPPGQPGLYSKKQKK